MGERRDDTNLIAAVGGYQRFTAVQRALRAQWLKSREVSEAARSLVGWYLSPADRFWCAAMGIERADGPAVEAARRFALALSGDHVEVFERRGRAVVYTAQPLFEEPRGLDRERAEWRAAADAYGLSFESSYHHAWRYPGRSMLFALWLPGESGRG